MAHNVEPMDIDNIESDFDNKENSIHHSNVYPRTPCTEKGYEELDVSELNMKLRYSITPASSPMSKSYTANCVDNRGLESGDDNLNHNLTRSLHSAISKDVLNKPVKTLPLQTISTEQYVDNSRNASVLRPLDTTSVIENNVTITVSENNEVDENMSFPSSSSSTAQTPEAITPTKEISRDDGGSPIMRGLKSVLNMFRSSQSPIPPADHADSAARQVLSPADISGATPDSTTQSASSAVLASTPIDANKHKECNLSKRCSPLKESLVFNEDLEKELLWKDETTILFSHEKIPISKLFFQQGPSNVKEPAKQNDDDFNSTVEYMDISANDSMIKNRTITDLAEAMHANESDCEFVDCETTFTNDKANSYVTDQADINIESKNTSKIAVLSSINAETNNELAVKIEPSSVVGELSTDLQNQLPNVTIPLNETLNIPQATSETEVKHDSNNSMINDVDTVKLNTVSEVENYDKIETETKTESHITLPIIETPTLLAESSTVNEETQPEITQQLEVNIESPTVSSGTEIIPSSVNIPALNLSEKHELQNETIAHSIPQNIEVDETIKKIENVAEVLDIKNTIGDGDKASVPAGKAMDTLDVPANIPLPDEEDIENEKSIGTIILVEEGTVPFSEDVNNKTFTGPTHSDHVENMPTIPAKSIDTNKTVNAINDFVAIDTENKPEEIGSSDTKNLNNDNVPVEINSTQEDIKPVTILPLPEPMDINESICYAGVTEDIKLNLDNTMKPVSEDKAETIQLDCKTVFETPKDVINPEIMVEKNEIPATEVHNMPSVVDCSDIIKEIPHLDPSEIKIEENVKTDTVVNEGQDHVEESEKLIPTINDPAVISDAIQENVLVSDGKDVEIKITESETFLENQLNYEKVSTVEAIPKDIEGLVLESNLVNTEKEPIEQANTSEVTKMDVEMLSMENTPIDVINNIVNKDEEIVLSENNSPYVSLVGQIDKVPEQPNLDEVKDPFATKTKVVITPPSSPVIVSKGYNFNFDEIDDPFATKTKIRMSPTPDTPTRPANEDMTFDERPSQRDINKNRRKSQPERKKPVMQKKKMNSTFSGSVDIPKTKPNNKLETKQTNMTPDNKNKSNVTEKPLDITLQESSHIAKEKKSVDIRDVDTTMDVNAGDNKSSVESLNATSNETKYTSSSEQSTYYSAGTSSSEGTMTKNVFNLPEIDDMNFNPFVTKSKMRQSPPPSLNSTAIQDATLDLPSAVDNQSTVKSDSTFTESPFETKSKMRQSPSPSLDTTENLNATQNLPKSIDITSNFKSDATFTENPFETKCKMRQSPPPGLDVTANLNVTQDLPKSTDVASNFKSDATFTKNPFETRSKMRNTPPPSLNATTTLNATQDLPNASETSMLKSDATFTENPFETKSKMRNTPPPSLNATTTLNSTQDLPNASETSMLKSDATFTENPFETKSKMRQSPSPSNTTMALDITQELSSHYDTSLKLKADATITEFNTDEKDANTSNTSCSSKATDEKDLTVREVHTEDEDTIEGPFLEAEDLNTDDKMSDFDGEDVDMMQFSELPAQGAEDNADAGELFIDAEAFEFLLNQNKSNVVADSGKESLFLKFDPLFAKRMSTDGVLAALNKKRQSTPKKMTTAMKIETTFDKSIAGPSTLNVTQEVANKTTNEDSTDDFNVTVSKPMMVVTPAVNPIVTPRNKILTPPSSNRRSITFTSPAIAVIDRLLSLSANNSLVGHDTTVSHVSREQTEADLALTQLRELLAEKEINVYNLRTESKELKDRLSTMESQMRMLESESQDRLKKINDLNEKLSEKTKINKSMAAVVEEYERTIASLIAETEQDKKRNNEERIRLIKERDEQTAHLASMEVSFSDLHSKYEKSKQIILTCKANEDSYKKSIKEFEENLNKMQSNYELLKQHATSKLNHANSELEKMNRTHEADVLKLNAMIKRKDLHITSLEETLAQKTKANEELTAICDELINKVG
ncbi:mucin-4-like [Ostrinia nubilalis]|uniref:mucin-4-like n=1 Tax=Ostrinia nubilalis TaxID=29057 RepID=UPI0030822D91